jgi:hypothetical protein
MLVEHSEHEIHSWSARKFQVSEVGLNFVLNDFRSAELNDSRSFSGRGKRTLARESLIFNLIESQLTPALRLQRVHTSIDPLTIEVQEIPSLGVFLLDATDDYNVWFDSSV